MLVFLYSSSLDFGMQFILGFLNAHGPVHSMLTHGILVTLSRAVDTGAGVGKPFTYSETR